MIKICEHKQHHRAGDKWFCLDCGKVTEKPQFFCDECYSEIADCCEEWCDCVSCAETRVGYILEAGVDDYTTHEYQWIEFLKLAQAKKWIPAHTRTVDADGWILCGVCWLSCLTHTRKEAKGCYQKMLVEQKKKDEEGEKARRSSTLSTRQGRGMWDTKEYWDQQHNEMPEEASRWFRHGSLPTKHCPFCQKPVKEHTKEQSETCLSRLGDWG